jgi:oxygen-independent coproporphyrinogen-3 oxidase
MYSVPSQTVREFVDQVSIACELQVDNISQYRMKLPPSVPLKKAIDAGNSPPQLSRAEWTDMQLKGWDEAASNGYHRWNTKNFGRTEDEYCRYSFRRYYSTDLLPIGCGGGGRIGLLRFSTDRDLDSYCERVRSGSFPYSNGSIGNMDELYLNTYRGLLQQRVIDLGKLGTSYQVDSWQIHQEQIENLSQKGLIKVDGNKISLTKLGVVWWPEISYELDIQPGTVQISYDELGKG